MFNLISSFFGWVLSPILNLLNFPVVPPELVSIMNTVFGYLKQGMSVLSFFVPMGTIKPAITVFLVIYGVYHAYLIVMFILKKIPFIGIK